MIAHATAEREKRARANAPPVLLSAISEVVALSLSDWCVDIPNQGVLLSKRMQPGKWRATFRGHLGSH